MEPEKRPKSKDEFNKRRIPKIKFRSAGLYCCVRFIPCLCTYYKDYYLFIVNEKHKTSYNKRWRIERVFGGSGQGKLYVFKIEDIIDKVDFNKPELSSWFSKKEIARILKNPQEDEGILDLLFNDRGFLRR